MAREVLVSSKLAELTEEIRQAVLRQLENAVYYGGQQAYYFEKELAAYLGTRQVLSVNSGTSAMLVAAVALGITRGDEVVVPANVYPHKRGSNRLPGCHPSFL